MQKIRCSSIKPFITYERSTEGNKISKFLPSCQSIDSQDWSDSDWMNNGKLQQIRVYLT